MSRKAVSGEHFAISAHFVDVRDGAGDAPVPIPRKRFESIRAAIARA